MISFVWNIVLALIWAAATEQFTLGNLLVGFAAGYVILWIMQPVIGSSPYFRKVRQAVGFFFFFLREVIRANLRVAYDVVTPTNYMKPGIVAVPLDAKTDMEIMLLANLITLTPGTLSLDVSPDRNVLYIHAMYVEDPERLKQEIKEGLERRILELLR